MAGKYQFISDSFIIGVTDISPSDEVVLYRLNRFFLIQYPTAGEPFILFPVGAGASLFWPLPRRNAGSVVCPASVFNINFTVSSNELVVAAPAVLYRFLVFVSPSFLLSAIPLRLLSLP